MNSEANSTVAGIRVCTKCGIPKPATVEFFVPHWRGDLLRGHCRECERAYQAAYRKRDPEKWRVYHKKRYRKYIEKPEQKEKRLEAARAYHHKNKEKANAASREYYRKRKAAGTLWQTNGWPKRKRKQYLETRRLAYQRRKQSPSFRLRDAISSAMHICLKGKKEGQKWESLVGYSLAELIVHLERQFTGKMNWQNYGKWHVDHIVPLCSFSFETPSDPDFKAAWALTNLRPLWRIPNIKKGGKRLHLL
jgi:hypothetical protein